MSDNFFPRNKSTERIIPDFFLLRFWQMQDRFKELAKLQILPVPKMSGKWNETFMGSQRNRKTGEMILSSFYEQLLR